MFQSIQVKVFFLLSIVLLVLTSQQSRAGASSQPNFFLPLSCGITASVSTYDGHTQHAADLNVGSGSDDSGLPVLAAAAGKVSRVFDDNGEIDIDHGDGWVTRYAHMDPVGVSVGDTVKQGDKIGEVGAKSAFGTISPHLHFSIKKDGSPYPGTVQDSVLVKDWEVVTLSITSKNCSIREGSHLVDESGRGYVVAGNFPVYVRDWDHVGGKGNAIEVSQDQLNKMRSYPKNGTYVTDRSGRVFVFAGGAPLYVQAWSNVGGLHTPILVDDWTLDTRYHLQYYPLDGTLIADGRSGKAYVIAGGAPLYIETWDNWGATQHPTIVDDWAIAHAFRGYPRNDTVVTTGRRCYVFAGGTALYFTDWENIGGQRPATLIDDWELVNYDHAYLYPVDNTFVTSGQTGEVYKVFAGQTTYVENWEDVGGRQPTTIVDDWAIQNQLHGTK